jgi:ATP-binding cassette, subfamily G (WHITE), member 2
LIFFCCVFILGVWESYTNVHRRTLRVPTAGCLCKKSGGKCRVMEKKQRLRVVSQNVSPFLSSNWGLLSSSTNPLLRTFFCSHGAGNQRRGAWGLFVQAQGNEAWRGRRGICFFMSSPRGRPWPNFSNLSNPPQQLWVPAYILGHVIGFALLLYSVEKTTGLLSQGAKRLRGGAQQPPPAEPTADPPPKPVLPAAKLMTDDDETYQRAPRWERGCACKAPCHCAHRWTPLGAPALKDAPLTDATYSLRAPAPADLAWAGLTCTVIDKHGDSKMILHPASGAVVPGELAALVGPSGAGKTTLLDMLAGRKTTGRLAGSVFMNGHPVDRAFKRLSAYVAQEDVFVPTLTATETLRFHARLRAERGTPAATLDARMSAVLEAMGLARVATTTVGGVLPSGQVVGGLSGGERRRLTIACSLVALPSILFLDEPTTGLDSFAAYNIMEHMAKLAAGGHTVIATIHQPRQSIWDMFHKVCVLSEGRQLYFGSPDAAAAWFDRALGYEYVRDRDGAVSDWLMDLVSVAFAKPPAIAERSMTTMADLDDAAEQWEASGRQKDDAGDAGLVAAAAAALPGAPKPPVAPAINGTTDSAFTSPVEAGRGALPTATKAAPTTAHRYPATYRTQFAVLLHRSLLAQLRNPTDVTSRLLLSTWMGTLAGVVFISQTPGTASVFSRLALLFFTMLMFQLMPFCYMSLYIADRAFYAADVAAGLYHPAAYYLAHNLAAAPFIILNTLIGGLCAYGLGNLSHAAKNVVRFCVLQVLQALCAVQMMVLAVYLTPNQDVAYVISIAYVSLSILLSGFYIRASDIPFRILRWMSYLSYPRYAFQGLAMVELNPDIYLGTTTNCLSGGMLGATDGEISTMLNAPDSARMSTMDGQTCIFVYFGSHALKFWDLSKMSLATNFGALIGFLAYFHVASYVALRTLYKAQR